MWKLTLQDPVNSLNFLNFFFFFANESVRIKFFQTVCIWRTNFYSCLGRQNQLWVFYFLSQINRKFTTSDSVLIIFFPLFFFTSVFYNCFYIDSFLSHLPFYVQASFKLLWIVAFLYVYFQFCFYFFLSFIWDIRCPNRFLHFQTI